MRPDDGFGSGVLAISNSWDGLLKQARAAVVTRWDYDCREALTELWYTYSIERARTETRIGSNLQ